MYRIGWSPFTNRSPSSSSPTWRRGIGTRIGSLRRHVNRCFCMKLAIVNTANQPLHLSIGVENEAAVVGLGVLRPRTRLAVALVAGVDELPPPRVDRLAALDTEADVEPSSHRMLVVRGDDPVVAELEPLAFDGRRPERERVEGARRVDVRDADVEVVEHLLDHARSDEGSGAPGS